LAIFEGTINKLTKLSDSFENDVLLEVKLKKSPARFLGYPLGLQKNGMWSGFKHRGGTLKKILEVIPEE